jgi:hypothetical protein
VWVSHILNVLKTKVHQGDCPLNEVVHKAAYA